MTRHELIQRLQRHASAVAREYPTTWDDLEDLRKARGNEKLAIAAQELFGRADSGMRPVPRICWAWPSWCWVPLRWSAPTVAAVNPDGSARNVERITALGTWRITQGIYQIDATLLDALWDTDLDGDIPAEVLYRLPEWCVYITTPGREVDGSKLAGFFAFLNHDYEHDAADLVLLLDMIDPDQLSAVTFPTWCGALSAAFQHVAEVAEFGMLMDEAGLSEDYLAEAKKVAERRWMACAPLVSLVLYLCSTGAEIRDHKGSEHTPARPEAVNRRGETRWMAAPAPTTWEVGYRIGAELRAALERERASGKGMHASPRAHVRRAHWHTYRIGPGREQLDLRWLSPILVGTGDRVPTIRRVQPA